jgi:hypothetical protein
MENFYNLYKNGNMILAGTACRVQKDAIARIDLACGEYIGTIFCTYNNLQIILKATL